MASNGKKPSATLVVLREIRDELKATNARVDNLTGEVRTTNERVDALTRHVTEMDVRLSTAIVEMVGAFRELRDTLRETRDGKVADIERRLSALERKVG
jgi:chromosome segregation ATPase